MGFEASLDKSRSLRNHSTPFEKLAEKSLMSFASDTASSGEASQNL